MWTFGLFVRWGVYLCVGGSRKPTQGGGPEGVCFYMGGYQEDNPCWFEAVLYGVVHHSSRANMLYLLN